MKFNRLRLSGFKSFVEPVNLDILPGLTAIIGPNGCGKSNLVEALRWVMGETSYKSMRASAMEDVIFAGTSLRPARNHAEVTLFLDNQSHTAPAEFNADDMLEVTRRIERQAGSAYRVNGRDLRARDVQLLFADASTGARSTALVRQGQISDLINAKPENRRKILEEAAGISGLHTRRHDAELRLNAAQKNLEQLAQNMEMLQQQLRALKRQTRQAARYKDLSADIRKTEALALHVRWKQAMTALNEAQHHAAQCQKDVQEKTQISAKCTTIQTQAQNALAPLLQAEAESAAALRRLQREQETLETEETHARNMLTRLEQQATTISNDKLHEASLLADARTQIDRLTTEHTELTRQTDTSYADKKTHSDAMIKQLTDKLSQAEYALNETRTLIAAHMAKKQSLEQAYADNQIRQEKINEALKAQQEKRDSLSTYAPAQNTLATLAAETKKIADSLTQAQKELAKAKDRLEKAETEAEHALIPVNQAQALLERLLGERAALSAIFSRPENNKTFPALIDSIKVEAGYEIALGAALGDDLDASTDAQAPAYWLDFTAYGHMQELPEGAESLSNYVRGAQLLHYRLTQIGVVDKAHAQAMQPQLRPGQKLVSREGDLWRWDGYCLAADAPSAAAKRLAQRNRLNAIETEIAQAEQQIDHHTAYLTKTRHGVTQAKQNYEATHKKWRELEAQKAELYEKQTQTERDTFDYQSRLKVIDETITRLSHEKEELAGAQSDTSTALTHLQASDDLSTQHEAQRRTAEDIRTQLAAVQAQSENIHNQHRAHEARLSRINEELASWTKRAETAQNRIDTLQERSTETQKEYKAQKSKPEEIAKRRNALLDLIVDAKRHYKDDGDKRIEAEAYIRKSDTEAKQAQSLLAEARETQARREAMQEAQKDRLDDAERLIRESLQIAPEATLALSGYDADMSLPALDETEKKLDGLRRERENLGGVNLRAHEEQQTVETQFDEMQSEYDDLNKAVNKLRHGIRQLNREGRTRLLRAFDDVNAHFERLFMQLFGGGKAHLSLTESDDPLEAGLEIIAHPPGKKPQILSLLSGGEQALTATALIFAVFLTNPSPICVLDEVDAPLDDSNVERLCKLIRTITEETQTRFIIITHHPLTMARVDRLFGVTMQEHGVSQLLSVDLATAESFVESGKTQASSETTSGYAS